jgi:hypothetical protein
MPCVPGFSYRERVQVRRGAGFNGAIVLGCNFLDRTGAFVCSNSRVVVNNQSSPLGAATNNTYNYPNIVAPANAVYMQPWLAVAWGASAPAGGAWFGSWVFRANAILNQHLTRDDGVTGVSDAVLVTLLGTAAAITGQGPLATDSRGGDDVWSRYPNLVYNGSFRLGVTGWVLGGTWALYASGSGDGPYIASIANGTNVTYSDGPGDWFPIHAGNTYRLQAEMLASNVTAGDFRMDVEYIDGAGNSLGKATPAATVGYAAGHAMASAGRWAYQQIASRGRSNP